MKLCLLCAFRVRTWPTDFSRWIWEFLYTTDGSGCFLGLKTLGSWFSFSYVLRVADRGQVNELSQPFRFFTEVRFFIYIYKQGKHSLLAVLYF